MISGAISNLVSDYVAENGPAFTAAIVHCLNVVKQVQLNSPAATNPEPFLFEMLRQRSKNVMGQALLNRLTTQWMEVLD